MDKFMVCLPQTKRYINLLDVRSVTQHDNLLLVWYRSENQELADQIKESPDIAALLAALEIARFPFSAE